MCERCADIAAGRTPLARRGLLKLAAVTAAGLALAPSAMAAKAKAPPKPQNVLSPDAALQRLMRGNARYVEGVSKRHDFKHEREPLSTGQNPFAGVLSCADFRARKLANDIIGVRRIAVLNKLIMVFECLGAVSEVVQRRHDTGFPHRDAVPAPLKGDSGDWPNRHPPQ